ncbi:lactonase family protein [Noviherbaspirillum cavernae]|nr:beta-propeller fold lactonase family protein [Noviherbaspirillum cavernae]
MSLRPVRRLPATSIRPSIPALFGRAFCAVLLTGLVACGGGNPETARPPAPVVPPAATSHTISGSVSGLAGSGLILQNNAGNDLAVSANGSFSFSTALASGANYAVSVKTLPTGPTQTCTVNNGSGTVAGANVSNIAIVCSTNSYAVGGTVSGLNSSGLVLQNNAGNDLAISANGGFTFTTRVASGANYAVTVKTQPRLLSQTCTVNSGNGTITAGDVVSVTVNCVTPTPRFAYVANMNSASISIYTIDATTGALSLIGTVFNGTPPSSIAVDPSGKFVYVANINTNSISARTIDPATGALTPIGSLVTGGTAPRSVTVDPGGKFVYVANQGSSNVSAFSIDAATGALTAAGLFPTGSGPISVTVAPSGKFLYTANANTNTVSAFTIDTATGGLSAATAIITQAGPSAVAVDPSGKFAYTANTSGTATSYAINAATGALAVVGFHSPGGSPISASVDPSGKFAYVVNRSPDSVSAYTIDAATGALAFTGTIGFGAGTGPRFITVDPSGRFAYIANENINTIGRFAINPVTGALTPVGVTASGGSPVSIAIVGQ